MRLKLKLSKNKEPIPFSYQHKLVGTIHKWLGDNTEHGKTSTFSFSQLQQGEITPKGFNFPNGSTFYFSSTSKSLLISVYQGIKKDPNLFNGLTVIEINILENPKFKSKERFILLSPLFFKQKEEGSKNPRHYTFEHNKINDLITESVKRRLEHNGIIDNSLKIYFDQSYSNKKTKVVTYRGISNKASVCPIIVEGKQESMNFLWNNGVGHSTGIGFGCLK